MESNASNNLVRVFSDEQPLHSFTLLPEQDDYKVHIPNFEGPLDLLLHLIRREQLNIYDIPVSKICASYLEHLELMKRFDINMASEFMVMAATLTYLKSAVLLPKDETEEEEDPRMPLVQQLLEYERFKLAAEGFEKQAWLNRDVFPRPASAAADLLPPEEPANAPVAPIEIFQLLVCLKLALDRSERPPMEIEAETTSIKEKVAIVGRNLIQADTIEFQQLLPASYTRKDIIVSFLAILELAKLNYIEIIQVAIFGPIALRRKRDVTELDVSMLDSY